MILIKLMLITLIVAICIAAFHVLALHFDGSLHISRFRVFVSIWLPAAIAKYAYSRNKLDFAASVASFLVGSILVLHSYAHMAAMITFFITSSSFTKFRYQRKEKFETDLSQGGQRNWIQVLSNGGAATLFALLAMIGNDETFVGGERRLRMTKFGFDRMLWYDLAILGSIASAAGDTWASEIGSVVGYGDPMLIINFKRVPRGTNGAVSLVGTLASIGGGLAVGVAYWLMIVLLAPSREQSLPQWILILICSMCGLVGSIFDSVLGATLQYSGYNTTSRRIVEKPGPDVQHISGCARLDNNSVNLLTSLASSLMAPVLARFISMHIF